MNGGAIMKENNLFRYATKELSQDALFCWLINWINYPESTQYPVGVATLNLFLGKNKPDTYFNVQVKRQYKKIDVLILFNDRYALIIEDKTNTSEHGEQIARYRDLMKDEYPDKQIMTAYIKTGIIYDEDARIIHKADTVVTLEDLLATLEPYKESAQSDILRNYVAYISEISEDRTRIREEIESGQYENALKTEYGQFSFLDQVFHARSKGTEVGKYYIAEGKLDLVYKDYVYAGSNNGGTPWTQYCFFAQKYPQQLANKAIHEYQYLFWRIDCNWARIEKKNPDSAYVPEYYIALRHYDENTKVNDSTRQRKREAYQFFREKCTVLEARHPELFRKVGVRENYKESDLLFIPIRNISELPFWRVKELLREITEVFTQK